ncbi:MAG: DUF1326 domain-containing protein, partial [Gemmatimonadales bacterium]
MTPATDTAARPAFRVRAQSVEACNCAHGCNCQFGGTPNEGICEFIIGYDERASPEQVSAFATILSGQAGGMPWEALAGTIERFEGPIARPIDLKIDRQRAHVRIPGAIELETTPLRDPVTGVEKEVHITYPKGGFFWNDGNVVTTTAMRMTHDSMR